MKFVKPLSREKINSVSVIESGESMVDLSKIPNLFFAAEISVESKRVRKSVVEKICRAADRLPKGVFLKIYSAYRSQEIQLKMFMEKLAEIEKKFPNLQIAEQERQARLAVADPRGGKYGPHQTGGAIDLTLCDKNGNEFDMAGKWNSFNELTPTYPTRRLWFFPLFRRALLTGRQLKNRKTLYDVMTGQGFVNYPLEWWHYCYGDRMWAAYSGKQDCPYGNAGDLK